MGNLDNIRTGAPYNDPTFEALCRAHDIWGTEDAALCAAFWETAKRQQQTLSTHESLAQRLREHAASSEPFGYVYTEPDSEMVFEFPQDRWPAAKEGRLRYGVKEIPVYAAPVAAQAQPTMPPLTEAMRAVLRNENDVYGDEDALYSALCDAAQAQPASRALLQEFFDALDKAHELDSRVSAWSLKIKGSQAERLAAWCRVHDLRKQLLADAPTPPTAASASRDPSPTPEEEEAWQALEREHLGDPEKRTGIYSPEVHIAARAALAQQDSDDIPYPHLPGGLGIATRHQSGTTTYRAEMRDEQDRLTIGGSWHPTRQAATAEAWAIKCDHLRAALAQQPSGQDLEDAERYRWIKANIEKDYELPGGYYIPDEDTDTWDKTIDAARAAAKGE